MAGQRISSAMEGCGLARSAITAACVVAAAALLALAPTDTRAADISPAKPAAGAPAKPIDTARAAIERKDFPAAIGQLKSLVAAEPRNADAHNLLGFALRKSGDLGTSKKHYDEALRLQPDHRGAHEYIGELYLMMKQPDEARKHLASLERICGGTGCEEYQDLAKAVAAYKP